MSWSGTMTSTSCGGARKAAPTPRLHVGALPGIAGGCAAGGPTSSLLRSLPAASAASGSGLIHCSCLPAPCLRMGHHREPPMHMRTRRLACWGILLQPRLPSWPQRHCPKLVPSPPRKALQRLSRVGWLHAWRQLATRAWRPTCCSRPAPPTAQCVGAPPGWHPPLCTAQRAACTCPGPGQWRPPLRLPPRRRSLHTRVAMHSKEAAAVVVMAAAAAWRSNLCSRRAAASPRHTLSCLRQAAAYPAYRSCSCSRSSRGSRRCSRRGGWRPTPGTPSACAWWAAQQAGQALQAKGAIGANRDYGATHLRCTQAARARAAGPSCTNSGAASP